MKDHLPHCDPPHFIFPASGNENLSIQRCSKLYYRRLRFHDGIHLHFPNGRDRHEASQTKRQPARSHRGARMDENMIYEIPSKRSLMPRRDAHRPRNAKPHIKPHSSTLDTRPIAKQATRRDQYLSQQVRWILVTPSNLVSKRAQCKPERRVTRREMEASMAAHVEDRK